MPVLSAKHVFPVTSDLLDDGAVVVRDGKIAFVGDAARATDLYPEEQLTDYGNAVIMPGLVNCHTHLELTSFRGLVDHLDNDFAAWLLEITRLRNEKSGNGGLFDSALLGACEALASGVTTVGEIARFGLNSLEALKTSGLRGTVYQETEFSPDASTADQDFEKLLAAFEALKLDSTDRIRTGISPHTPFTVSRKLFEKIASFAAENRIPVTIHAAESRAETELMRTGKGFFSDVYKNAGVSWDIPGTGSIEFLKETGILDAKPLLAHCVHADSSDISIIADRGAAVAHCPKSNAKLGHGTAPLFEFLQKGVTVGLGTDSMASNNHCDLFEEARFAGLLSRIRSEASEFLNARELLEIATIGGARALGLDKVTGSLEQGKQADVIVISLDGIGQRPVSDIASTLVFSTGSGSVQMTMVAGEILFQDGIFTNPDSLALKQSVN